MAKSRVLYAYNLHHVTLVLLRKLLSLVKIENKNDIKFADNPVLLRLGSKTGVFLKTSFGGYSQKCCVILLKNANKLTFYEIG